MSQTALHVQHKSQETFDRENRVLSFGVVAVSDDTGDIRLGDGKKNWRDLDRFGDVDVDNADDNPVSGYSGALHARRIRTSALSSAYVPAANEMVVLDGAVYFGDGKNVVSNLAGKLTVANAVPAEVSKSGRAHLTWYGDDEIPTEDVVPLGHLVYLDADTVICVGDGSRGALDLPVIEATPAGDA